MVVEDDVVAARVQVEILALVADLARADLRVRDSKLVKRRVLRLSVGVAGLNLDRADKLPMRVRAAILGNPLQDGNVQLKHGAI